MSNIYKDRVRSRLLPAQLSVVAAILIFLMLTASVIGQTPDSLRVEQVVRDAIAHNDRVAAAKYMETAAELKIAPAGAWDDPMLMAGLLNVPMSFDFKMDPMTMKMVGLSQNIPFAGQKGLQKKAAAADARAATQERYATENDVAMAARYAFADLYYRGRSLSDLVAQHELLQQVVEAAKARLTTNAASQDEVLSAEAELWRLQIQMLEADHMVAEANYNLNLLRSMDVSSINPPLAAPNIAAIPQSPDTWLDAAREQYPPLQKLARQSEAYRFSADASRRMSWPMLNLSAGYGFRSGLDMAGNPNDNMVSLQATISLPIFAGRQQRQMARSMDAMRLGVDAEASQKRREIEARLRILHATAQHLVETVDLYRQQIIPADQDAFRSALAGYATNRLPFTSLLTYASGIYRDRLGANQAGNQLARTMAEVENYTAMAGSARSRSEKH